MADLRFLAVHAHADDETITMGGTLSVLGDAGVRTAVACCTDGELATIVDPTMDEAMTRPRLAEIRRGELHAACVEMGVAEVHFLGYHDSGMAGADTNEHDDAFWVQPLDGVVGELVGVIRAFRPHVVATYDGYGGYGHPDHIQTHRASLVAVEAARFSKLYPERGPGWEVSKLYYTVIPRSVLRAAAVAALAAGLPHPFDGADPDALEFGCADSDVTTVLDVRAGLGRRRRALLAHRSQISPEFPMLRIPDDLLSGTFGHEHYRLAMSTVPVALPENDLFAGVDSLD